MLPNFSVLAATAFIPFLFGYIWFHPKVCGGDTWYDVAKITGKDRKEVSKRKLFSTLILNFLLSLGVFIITVHQFSVLGLVGGNQDLLMSGTGAAFINEHGNNFLTFKHGIAHALQGILCFVIPILGYVTIFEHKGIKYFLVYLGYWVINLCLIAGIISVWGTVPIA